MLCIWAVDMCSGYVQWICAVGMCSGYVLCRSICAVDMCSVHVLCTCVMDMCSGHVQGICAVDMCCVYVLWICAVNMWRYSMLCFVMTAKTVVGYKGKTSASQVDFLWHGLLFYITGDLKIYNLHVTLWPALKIAFDVSFCHQSWQIKQGDWVPGVKHCHSL